MSDQDDEPLRRRYLKAHEKTGENERRMEDRRVALGGADLLQQVRETMLYQRRIVEFVRKRGPID